MWCSGPSITGHPPVRPGDPPPGSFFPSDEEYPEPLVALAATAAVTASARLSTNILIAPLRLDPAAATPVGAVGELVAAAGAHLADL